MPILDALEWRWLVACGLMILWIATSFLLWRWQRRQEDQRLAEATRDQEPAPRASTTERVMTAYERLTPHVISASIIFLIYLILVGSGDQHPIGPRQYSDTPIQQLTMALDSQSRTIRQLEITQSAMNDELRRRPVCTPGCSNPTDQRQGGTIVFPQQRQPSLWEVVGYPFMFFIGLLLFLTRDWLFPDQPSASLGPPSPANAAGPGSGDPSPPEGESLG